MSPDARRIDEVRIVEFGCVKDLTLKLTPLHALIGPNDVGKSTVLAALEHWMFVLANEARPNALQKSGTTFGAVVAGTRIAVSYKEPHGYQLDSAAIDARAGKQMRPPRLVRFDPEQLRQDGPLLPRGSALSFNSPRGSGLAPIYDALLKSNRRAFDRIEHEVGGLFPQIERLDVDNATAGTVTLRFGVRGVADPVPIRSMSEGLLYFLAFRALEFLAPTSIVLVEEPENGLHPSRIREVVGVLRKLSETTPVLMATHSPMVINELEGDEITVLTRTESEGTRGVRLCDTPHYAERSEVYRNGELWVSYADGTTEARLIQPGAEP